MPQAQTSQLCSLYISPVRMSTLPAGRLKGTFRYRPISANPATTPMSVHSAPQPLGRRRRMIPCFLVTAIQPDPQHKCPKTPHFRPTRANGKARLNSVAHTVEVTLLTNCPAALPHFPRPLALRDASFARPQGEGSVSPMRSAPPCPSAASIPCSLTCYCFSSRWWEGPWGCRYSLSPLAERG